MTWPLLAFQPSSAELGTWIMIAILLVPAAKVVVDWIRPPQTRLVQPIGIRLEERFATKQELAKLECDLQAQLKDMRSYLHEEVHKLRDDLQAHWTNTDRAAEGLHDRINALVKVTYQMRGLCIRLTGEPNDG